MNIHSPRARREGRQTLKGGAPSFSTEALECTFHRLSTPSFGQWLALNCTHLKKFVVASNTMMGCIPTGDQAALPLPFGHPAPRPCRGNDACATGRPLQTPGLLHVLVCQTNLSQPVRPSAPCRKFGRNVRDALHQPGQYKVLAGNFTVTLALNKCSLSEPLNKFTQISSEPLFSESWGQIQLGWLQPRAPQYFLLECQDGWLVVCFDNDTPTVSEAAASLHGSLNDISGIEI